MGAGSEELHTDTEALFSGSSLTQKEQPTIVPMATGEPILGMHKEGEPVKGREWAWKEVKAAQLEI